MPEEFTIEQKNYLQGFAAGSGIGCAFPLAKPAVESSDKTIIPDSIHRAAQDRFLSAGKKLPPEELAKRQLNGLDVWDLMLAHARDNCYPKGTDVFLMKFLGMFYVAPAQDSFMCRLRIPGGFLSSSQLAGIADLAQLFGGGYADLTTRSNLQIREIKPASVPDLLMGLNELGIINKGAGADNIRNITAGPTAGIDPMELIDTRPLARQMHYYILNHREMYGLPRKFNIAFDGGGAISALEETNDIGFSAVRVNEGSDIEPGIYFRLVLGGITGHGDFARDTGVLLAESECVAVAAAAVRVFIEHGDRTDRKKARLKYLLDRWGITKFVEETEKVFSRKLRRWPMEKCEPRTPIDKRGHVGVHRQKQPGKSYIGVLVPAGRLETDQMNALAGIAREFGSETIRLTVWQNLLISDIPDEKIAEVSRRIEEIGLQTHDIGIRGGLVACTGNTGCKYASANTKLHALAIAAHIEPRMHIDSPINIHLTGCPHSCAQHCIGDIGMLATKVERGDDMVEGYHIFVGGGYGTDQSIAREIARNIPADQAPVMVEEMLRVYLNHRSSERESFREYVCRIGGTEFKSLLDKKVVQ